MAKKAQRNQDSFMQTLLDGVESKLELKTLHEKDLTDKLLSVFAGPIGIAPGYSKSGGLVALAIADDMYCLIVQFYSNRPTTGNNARGRGRGGKQVERPNKERDLSGRKLLEEFILCREGGDLLAFDFGPLSMSLYCGVDLRITNGIDIQSAFSAVDRKPLSAIKDAVGDTLRIFEENVINVFQNPLYDPDKDQHCVSDLAMRAWISQYLFTIGNGAETFTKVVKINTKVLTPQTLDILAKMTQDSLRLAHLKPSEIKHTFMMTQNWDGPGVRSGAFQNRLRPGQIVTSTVQNAHGATYRLHGHTGGVDGRAANLDLSRPLDDTKTILTIKSIGRDDPTTAEAHRAATVLRILQGNLELLADNAWIKNIWFPAAPDDSGDTLLVWPPEWTARQAKANSAFPSSGDNNDRHNLNKSQQDAVDAMLSRSDTNRITIIQGPPGTGKTTVIATYVKEALERCQGGIWLVAKSNVAVINIALKLMSAGFMDWRLLVSQEFSHADWHGHLYESISSNFIRSNEFFSMSLNRIKGCKVILCTLSMLSNKLLKKFVNQVPVNTIVVDEASQIEVGDYIPVFDQYSTMLRKMCFIGDDKQLPPYGQEDLQDLQSIFEITHLRRLCLFLDTQYRMPPQIGAFISTNVYDDKLNSNSKHPISNSIIACQFIDVVGAKEQVQATTTSLINKLESEAVLKLAQHLQDHGKNYKIITPYDAQRVLVEDKMKETGLQWEEKVYNVDSFQGNEEDYIIISLVRSMGLGFLSNLRRTNVMLTRCKRGMYIVSSRAFLHKGPGKGSIVSELSTYVGDIGWLEMKDIETDDFLTNPKKQDSVEV
ncbi:AAA-12 domain-containing protein [Mycena sanguinolenta]|uniref:AAA-12 domain-containing protein n=1 Tax=Mycena sanguinolenta TaxID=230812 RepID=A0A8H6ZCC6_9AGAR|nr:AAA-12 domain-containing protein [Mycena sanguinolenta]